MSGLERDLRYLAWFGALGLMLIALLALWGEGHPDATPTPTPIVTSATLHDLTATTDRVEEVEREVAAAWASDEWERAVRSSARSLPLPTSRDVEGTADRDRATGGRGPRVVGATPAVSPTPAEVAATTEDSSPVGQLTEAEVYAAALAVSGSERWAREAVAVTWCESRWRPDAVGAAGERTIYQLHPVHGPVPDGLLARTEMAYALWQQVGWSAWSCGVGR